MKILLAGLDQETNTFCSRLWGPEEFAHTTFTGEEMLLRPGESDTEIGGMVRCILEHGDEPVPAVMMRAQSGGRVKKEVADRFAETVLSVYGREKPEAVFLAMHGGMALDHGIDDGTGYIFRKIREEIGTEAVMAASMDMHANLTRQDLELVPAVAGYHTYPHDDQEETGYRAALLGYRLLEGRPLRMAFVKIPMIVPAEGYSTESGVFAKLTEEARGMVRRGEILDFSLFQMQPWLNVREAGGAVLAAAETDEAAAFAARKLADRLFALRREMDVTLCGVDELIDLAEKNRSGMPVILADSADSPGAGSCGDSSAVLARLLERETDLFCALCVADAPAAGHAFEVGVGNEGEFRLGGTLDPVFQKAVTLRARVRSLHEGTYRNEGPAYRFQTVHAGRSAVLRVRNIDIVVMPRISCPYDLQLYRAFGVDPAMEDLVLVKSATQYRTGYRKVSSLFYTADTPGASTANLTSLPFDRIPRPFYPFDEISSFDDTPVLFP